eukprot:sb/3470920/
MVNKSGFIPHLLYRVCMFLSRLLRYCTVFQLIQFYLILTQQQNTPSQEYNASAVQSTFLPRVLQGICENMRVHQVRYQEFLSELLEQRVIKTYESYRDSSNEMTTVFNPACALLLDFACFPIFCHSDSETVDQIQLTDFSFPGQEEESVVLPGWLSSLLHCCKLTDWHEVVLTSVRTLSILIGITLSIGAVAKI